MQEHVYIHTLALTSTAWTYTKSNCLFSELQILFLLPFLKHPSVMKSVWSPKCLAVLTVSSKCTATPHLLSPQDILGIPAPPCCRELWPWQTPLFLYFPSLGNIRAGHRESPLWAPWAQFNPLAAFHPFSTKPHISATTSDIPATSSALFYFSQVLCYFQLFPQSSATTWRFFFLFML